jgi:hypothetical protein
MMKRWLNRLLHPARTNQSAARHAPTPERVRFEEGSLIKLNTEEWGSDAQQAFRSTATAMSNLTFYKGEVHHGYALRGLVTPERCPRCHAGTRQHYANFIYATQGPPRVMFAPAGYFCTQCPTVIIHEEMIRSGITGPFTFHGVLGIDDEDRHEPHFFRTWNGQEAVYIFDEDQTPQGIATSSPSQPPRRLQRRQKSRGRQRMAKASRRHNQRKR